MVLGAESLKINIKDWSISDDYSIEKGKHYERKIYVHSSNSAHEGIMLQFLSSLFALNFQGRAKLS